MAISLQATRKVYDPPGCNMLGIVFQREVKGVALLVHVWSAVWVLGIEWLP